jgi:hypothetical protein
VGKLEVHVRGLLRQWYMRPQLAESTLMALLYDSTLEFPAAYSKQALPSNAKSKKPSAWAEQFEEEEEPSRTERWTVQQRDLVISKKPKV